MKNEFAFASCKDPGRLNAVSEVQDSRNVWILPARWKNSHLKFAGIPIRHSCRQQTLHIRIGHEKKWKEHVKNTSRTTTSTCKENLTLSKNAHCRIPRKYLVTYNSILITITIFLCYC